MVTKKFLAAVQHGCDWFADPLPTHIIRKYYAEPWLEILNTLYLRMLCFGEFLPLNLSCICGLKCWILVWLLMIGMLDCPSRSMGTLRRTLKTLLNAVETSKEQYEIGKARVWRKIGKL